jgi:hypothetical protein
MNKAVRALARRIETETIVTVIVIKPVASFSPPFEGRVLICCDA